MDINPSPPIDVFLEAFKSQFLVTHSADDIIKRLRFIEQGSNAISKCSTDFEALVLQLRKTDDHLTKLDYICGLHYKIYDALIPTLAGNETLKDLINKATVITRNLKFGKSFKLSKARSSPSTVEPRTHFTSSTSSTTHTPPASTAVLSVNREMDSSDRFLLKLSKSEQEYLKKNNRCFNCRKTKVNHIAPDCFEDHSGSGVLVKGKYLRKEKVKKESISMLQVVESQSDSEYSRTQSTPTIQIAAKIGTAPLPSMLVDRGAMINIISEHKVIKHDIPTHPTLPTQIHEPLTPHGTRVDKKVISHVKIPGENQQPAEFVVAPLTEHDAILGMPFLAEEGILVNLAQNTIILPTVAAPTEDHVEGGTEFMASLDEH